MKAPFKISFVLSLILLLIGSGLLFMENYFVQGIDKDGVLIESWLLPIGSVLLSIGGIGCVLSMLIRLKWRR